jgi:low temperature requirement protein LtrA
VTGVGLLRTRERAARVTNVELFFDLVCAAVVVLAVAALDYRVYSGK